MERGIVMIKWNGNQYETKHFPDGTQLLKVEEDLMKNSHIECMWQYETEEELLTIMYLTRHFQEKGKTVSLIMPYIPNARMDRVKKDTEVFTLKYFAECINALNFTSVTVLDPHSNVSAALIDRVVIQIPKEYIEAVIDELEGKKGTQIVNRSEEILLYFPDEGAAKRYGEMFVRPYCYGMKKRRWEDGTILGIDIADNGIKLAEKTILMVDDIIAFGGSLYYSAKRLKELGCGRIYAFATHVEKSILDKERGKLLQSGLVERIYTTDSLFLEEDERIRVIKYKKGTSGK